jgi:glycosyltransferase involved in cell wall biosynthesis
MALGCPVICFNHQGVGWMTDDTSAIRIEPRSWEQSVGDFCQALIRLEESDELVDQLGKAARKRAMENFSWNAKIEAMTAIYESVIKAHHASYY